MAEPRPGTEAPATDSSPASRSVTEADIGEVSLEPPGEVVPQIRKEYVPKNLSGEGWGYPNLPQVTTTSPGGLETHYDEPTDAAKDYSKAISGTTNEDELLHDYIDYHTGHPYLISQEEMREELEPGGFQSLVSWLEPFIYGGSLLHGYMAKKAAEYLPDPTEEGEDPETKLVSVPLPGLGTSIPVPIPGSVRNSFGDSFEWAAGQIAKQAIAVADLKYRVAGMGWEPTEEDKKLYEDFGKKVYESFATGKVYEVGASKTWEHYGIGPKIGQHLGEDWIDATISKETAKDLSNSITNPYVSAHFNNLSTDTGRMMYGLAFDFAVDPLWLLGMAKGGHVVASAGKVWSVDGALANAARVAEGANKVPDRGFWDAAIHLVHGNKVQKGAARESFEGVADALAYQSSKKQKEAERLKDLLKSDEALAAHKTEAEALIREQQRLYEAEKVAFASATTKRQSAAAKAAITGYQKALDKLARDSVHVGKSAKASKKYIANRVKLLLNESDRLNQGSEAVRRALRVTAGDAPKLGLATEKGRFAWHIPIVGEKTHYLFQKGDIGSFLDEVTPGAVTRVIDDYFKPFSKESLLAAKEEARALGKNWSKTASVQEKTALALQEAGVAIQGYSYATIDLLAKWIGTRLWHPLVYAANENWAINKYARLKKLDPDTWDKYQNAIMNYSRTVNYHRDFIMRSIGLIGQQAKYAFDLRKESIKDGSLYNDILNDIIKHERMIEREKNPDKLFDLRTQLNLLKNDKAEVERWMSPDYTAHDVMLEVGTITEAAFGRLKEHPEFTTVNPATGKSYIDSIEELIKEFSIRFDKDREEVVQSLVEMARRMRGDPARDEEFVEIMKGIDWMLEKVDLDTERSLESIQTLAAGEKVQNTSFINLLNKLTPERLSRILEDIRHISDKPWNDKVHAEYIRRLIHNIVGPDHVNDVLAEAANYMGFRGNDGERALAALAKMVSGEPIKGGKALEAARKVGAGKIIRRNVNALRDQIIAETEALSHAASANLELADLKGVVSSVLDDQAKKALLDARTLVGDGNWEEFVKGASKSLKELKFKNTEDLMRSIGLDPKIVDVSTFKKARIAYKKANVLILTAAAARKAKDSYILKNLHDLGVYDKKLGLLTKDGLLSVRIEDALSSATSRKEAEDLIYDAVSKILPVDEDEGIARLARAFAERFGAKYKPKMEELVDLPVAAREPVAPTAVPVEEVAEPTIKFKTDSGSDYDFVGGKTKRTKTADVDENLKKDPDQTIFIDEDAAKEVEAWIGTSETQRRVSIVGDEVLLTSFPPVRPAGPAKPAPKVDVPPHMDDVPIEVMERAGVWYDPRPPSLEELEYYVSRDVRIISVHSESSLGPRPSWNVERAREWDEKLGTPSFVEDMWSHTGSWTVNPWWDRVVDEGPATRIAQPQQITSEARGTEDLYLDQIRFVVRDEPIPGYTDIEASAEATRRFRAKGMVRTVSTDEAGPRPYGPAPRPIPEELLDTERGLGFTIAESDEFGWLPALPTKPAESAVPQRRIFGRIKFTTEPEVGTYPLEVSQKTTITSGKGSKLDGYAAFNIPKRKVVEVTSPTVPEPAALKPLLPGAPEAKVAEAVVPWNMRNTRGQLVDAAEKAGIVVPPKATKAQILDSLKALGPRLGMTAGQRATWAVETARKELAASAKARQEAVDVVTKAQKKFVRAHAKGEKDALKAERKAVEEALESGAAGIYYPGHPEALKVKTDKGGTKTLPYRAMEDWEKELWAAFKERTAALSDDDAMFVAFTALRLSPTAPSEIQRWQSKYANSLPSFLGRRLGEVPEELQFAVTQLRALIKKYEDAYLERGAEWLKEPLEMMKEWGLIEYVPHIPNSRESMASASFAEATLAGWVKEADLIPMNTMDTRLSTATDFKQRRLIEGTILEVNTLKDGELVFDPPVIMSRYLAASRALTAEDFVLMLMRGGVIKRVSAAQGKTVAEVADEQQLVPLFERKNISTSQDVLFTQDKAAWEAAGIGEHELAQIKEAFNYKKKEGDYFATWFEDAVILKRVRKVENGIATIRAKQWSEHLQAPIAGELFDPKRLFDERFRKLDLTDLDDAAEARAVASTWDDVAKEFNAILSQTGEVGGVNFKVAGSDLSLFYGEGSEVWKLYIPRAVRVNMENVLGLGVKAIGPVRKVLGAINNFMKVRLTILSLAFHTRNHLSNQLSNILDLGVAGAMNPDSQIKAARLSSAASFVSEYGSLENAAKTFSTVLDDIPGSEARLAKILDTATVVEITQNPSVWREASDIIRALRWHSSGMDDLLKNGIDIGDGVSRSADEAITILEELGVVTPAYRNYVDLDTFETSFTEIVSKGFINGDWKAASRAVKALSIAEDVIMTAVPMLMTGGMPVAVPKSLGSWIARFVENQARVTNFIGNVKAGRSHVEAADHVAKFLFDYNDLTHVQKTWLRTAFTFFTWSQKNVHLQLEMMQKNPAFYSKFAQLFVYQLPEAAAASQYEEGMYPRDPEYLKRNLVLRDSHAMSYARIPLPKIDIAGRNIVPGKPGVYIEGLGLPMEAFAEITTGLGELSGIKTWFDKNNAGVYGDEAKFRLIGQMHTVAKMSVERATEKHAHYGVPLRDLSDGKLVAEIADGIGRVSPWIADQIKDMAGLHLRHDVTSSGRITETIAMSPTKNWAFANSPWSRVFRDASAMSSVYMLSTIASPEEAAEGKYEEVPGWLRFIDAETGIRIVQQHPYIRKQIFDRKVKTMYEEQLKSQKIKEQLVIPYIPEQR